ncbi:unnamed protein product [Microthlaspi erraticum]|uniref:Integrase catalytic domain-containing protein n=1 Tax=Microthlaspi erraticum TaxID=1685480 RepID=A0A6D2KSV4_9BRAS|nr:unnamed protein product [Microthlaspi erraticum]
MPFGLTNAPAAFMRLMNDVFREYLDVLSSFSLMIFCERWDFLATLFLQREFLWIRLRLRLSEIGLDLVVPRDQSFLGLAGYYRRFVKGFATMAQPMTKLTGKDVPFVWSAECEESFSQLKEMLTTTPVLALPEPGKPYMVYTDASGIGLGCVLMQEGRVIAYASRQWQGSERNRPTHDLELGAVIFALKIWRSYLLGETVQVFTDHKSLQHIFTQPMMNARQTRWVEFLADYQVNINYHPGKANLVADALSRRRYDSAEPLGLEAVDQADLLSRIRVAQQSDQSLLDATRVTGSEYEVSANGTILVRGRVCVPKDVELRQEIERLMRASFPFIRQSIRFRVVFCRVYPFQSGSGTGLRWISWLDYLFEDFRCYWVIVDRLTKSAHFLAIKKTDGFAVLAGKFVREIVRLHGVPASIVSDRDPRFTSEFWRAFQAEMGTKVHLSAAYHPQTDDHLSLVEFAYNNSFQASIGMAPFEALYGRPCRTPLCWTQVGERSMYGAMMIGFVCGCEMICNEMWWNATVVYDEVLDRVEAWPVELRNSTGWSSSWSSWSSRWLPPSSFAYPVELRPCAKSLHAPHVPYAPECSKRPISKDQTCILHQATYVQETTEKVRVVRVNMKEAQDRQKSYANRRRRELKFQVGDRVYLKMAMLKGPNRSIAKNKLSLRFMGPFPVVERVGPLA